MTLIDAALLAGLLAVATWRLLAPRLGRGARAVACVALVLLAGAQYALHGFTWQFVGGWLLLAAAALPVRQARMSTRIAGGLGLLLLMGAAAGPWALLPAPVLPEPRGPHEVGGVVLRWTDPTRAEDATADPADRREVIVQAWYPAGAARGGTLPYLDGLGRLPPRIMGIPRFVFRRYGEADTFAQAGAPVARSTRPWPVVVFSHGHGAARAMYSGLLADLASRGYVVLAVDHPYEAAVTQLADGRVVPFALDDGGADDTRHAYMERQVVVRAADVRFVLDQLARPAALGPVLAGRLDPTRVAVAGHSFGGATAVLVAGQDPRVRAAADIDGMLYGDPRGETFQGPLLLLESGGTQTIGPYMEATQAVLSRVPASGWRYAIGGASHLSFTDLDFMLSPPGRWAAHQVIGGPRGAADTVRTTVDILDAFLRGPLMGQRGDVAAAAARHPDVRGGPAS